MSHLSTLIERVRRIENNGRDERSLREKALNIAEFLTYSHDFSEEEAAEAREILRRYEMDALVGNRDAIGSFLNVLYPSRAKAVSSMGAVA
jgi:hypothetical protein